MTGMNTTADAAMQQLLASQSVAMTLFTAAFVVCLLGQMFVFNQASTQEFKRRKPKEIGKDEVFLESFGDEVVAKKENKIEKRKRDAGEIKKYTWEQVREHSTKDDLWLVVEGKVYDVTKFLEKHPGGYRPLVAMAGRDCTDTMAEYHPSYVFDKWLPTYFIGEVVDYEVSELLKDYRKIRQDLLARGLFKTNNMYYYAKFAWLASIFFPTIYFVVFCTSPLAHFMSACGLALFWQQLAFVGHDVGHTAVSHDRDVDYFYGGLFGNFLGGISLSWWKNSHNVHHVTCNSIEHDPDIQHLPFLAVTNKLFGKFWSTYHEKFFVTDAFARFFVSYQHILFYPIMMVARFNLYVQSWIMLLFRNQPVPHKKLEMASLAGFWVWMYIFISFLPSNERLPYLLFSHALAGILHVQITISHFAMETFHGTCTDDWVRHQTKTSMDVSCPKYMDWFHGGLQFQVVHHLFPRLPRHNLRIARDQFILLCQKHGMEYVEQDFITANKTVLTRLRETAMDARKLTKGDAGFYHSAIYEGLNAVG